MKNGKQPMSATAFRRWLKDMDYNHSEAARALDCSRTSIIKWAKKGAPKVVLLACTFLQGTRWMEGGEV